MVTGDLVTEMHQRYAREPGAANYFERISALAATNRS
jgi:hypothetical protein